MIYESPPKESNPGQWSETLFDKVAQQTRLGPDTLQACRRVMVSGEKGIDVAREMGLFTSQISRGVSGLLRKLSEIGDLNATPTRYAQAVNAHHADTDVSRDLAVSKAREIVGASFVIRDAVAGQSYIGKPLVKTSHHLVQSVGREAVIHDLAKLERAPNMLYPMMEVNYPKDGKLAQVQETAPGQERGGRSR